jgi:hypothetical protein
MYATLVKHEWLRKWRSSSFGRETATTIFIAFLVLVFGAYFLALAFFLQPIMAKFSEDTFALMNQILVYYLFTELLFRYFLQSSPILNIQPYLHLPVSKRNIIHFLLSKSLLSPFNFVLLLLLTPFTFMGVAPQTGTGPAILWLISLWSISLALHYFMIFFKKELDDKPIGLAIMAILIGLFGGSQYYGWFSLGEITAPFFSAGAGGVYPLLVGIGGIIAFYYFNYTFYLHHTYIEELEVKKSMEVNSRQIGFLQSMGVPGQLIQQELRLIFRHKRTRSILLMSAFLLLYGLIFYTNPLYLEKSPSLLLFVGIFITGIFMINYGQFLFGWNSSNFDFFLSKPVSLTDYIRSKYYLLSAVVLVVLCLRCHMFTLAGKF